MDQRFHYKNKPYKYYKKTWINLSNTSVKGKTFELWLKNPEKEKIEKNDHIEISKVFIGKKPPELKNN